VTDRRDIRAAQPRRPVTIIDATSTDDGTSPTQPVDLDTGDAGREDVAVQVAVARIDGANVIRTRDPKAARRAVAVIDAILDARAEPSDDT
jgi:hypothetical protein